MKNLRRNFERFCYRHRQAGIPNLMLFVAVGNFIVYFFSMADASGMLHSLLQFNRSAILQGQVWRLFSYIFTYMMDASGMNIILGVISLVCYYFIGKTLEQHWGTLRFNLYYLTGIVLMDIAALLIGCNATTMYLNTSLFLALATVMPDIRFLLFYCIPVKGKYIAWFSLGLTVWNVLTNLMYLVRMGAMTVGNFFYCLFPLIALANYFLFFGKDAANLLPDSMRYRKTATQRNYRAQTRQQPNPGWANKYRSSTGEKPYRHKCTVCGRTDTDFPYLEFRYCSRCSGYYCYCQDHINNHEHIQQQ